MTYPLPTHDCPVRHQHTRAFARCLWPRAVWISGSGPHALLAHCPPLTISLWSDLQAAQQAKWLIDATGCGHACRGTHEIIYLGDVT